MENSPIPIQNRYGGVFSLGGKGGAADRPHGFRKCGKKENLKKYTFEPFPKK